MEDHKVDIHLPINNHGDSSTNDQLQGPNSFIEIWDLYFATVASIAFHPGAGTRGHEKLTIQDCGNIADQMINERNKRCL